jgi:hypothetical protein
MSLAAQADDLPATSTTFRPPLLVKSGTDSTLVGLVSRRPE